MKEPPFFRVRLAKVLKLRCLLRRRYLAFNFIDFDSLRSACQISKSRQKIPGSGQQVQEKYLIKRQVGRPEHMPF